MNDFVVWRGLAYLSLWVNFKSFECLLPQGRGTQVQHFLGFFQPDCFKIYLLSSPINMVRLFHWQWHLSRTPDGLVQPQPLPSTVTLRDCWDLRETAVWKGLLPRGHRFLLLRAAALCSKCAAIFKKIRLLLKASLCLLSSLVCHPKDSAELMFPFL